MFAAVRAEPLAAPPIPALATATTASNNLCLAISLLPPDLMNAVERRTGETGLRIHTWGTKNDMRLRTLALTTLLVLTCASGAVASVVRVSVTPHFGASTSTFTVSYVAPTRTGVVGSSRIRDQVRAETGSVS